MASCTVRIFSASSSGISISKASSNAITSSTVSRESAPRSSTKEALEVTSPSSTPSCSTMICFTLSSTAAMSSPRLQSFPHRYRHGHLRNSHPTPPRFPAAGRRKAVPEALLLAHLGMLIDIGNGILHGAQLLGILVGNLHAEMLFQCHHQLDLVQ